MRFNWVKQLKEREISLRSVILFVVLVTLIGIVVSNVWQVVVSATDNYQVYVAEQQGLDELEAQYDQLSRELAYYKSYDYKELYARDNLKMVTPGSKLYKLNKPQQIYSVIDQQKQVVKEEDNLFWWRMLFLATFTNL
jgi:cell division protein FtsB